MIHVKIYIKNRFFKFIIEIILLNLNDVKNTVVTNMKLIEVGQ